jgi:protein O-mannosyl-transferase
MTSDGRFGRYRSWTLPGLGSFGLRRWNLDKKEAVGLFLVLLLVIGAYSRSMLNGFVFDDFPYIVFNQPLRHLSFAWLSWKHDVWWFVGSPDHVHSPYYRPIQNTFLALVFPIVGTSTLRWHILKILLHLVVVGLTFRLSQLLTSNTAISLVAALLFGVLTLHAEAVVWVSAFHEPLTAIFELGAFCAFINRPRGKSSGMVLPLILFGMAVFAHESAVGFPILIAAYDFLLGPNFDGKLNELESPAKTATLRWRFEHALLLSALFAVVDVLYVGFRVFALGREAVLGISRKAVSFGHVGNQIRIHANAINPPAFQVFSTLPLVIVAYLELFVLPWRAGPAHPVRFVSTPGLANFYEPMAILLLLGLIAYLVLHKSIHTKLYLFCIVWWLVTILPALNLNQVVSLVQDRYEYIPSVGLCILAAHILFTLASHGVWWQKATALGMVGFIAVQSVALWQIEPLWYDNPTMIGKCVEILPDSIFYREQLAAILRSRGDLAGAITQLTIAADRNRNNPENYVIHSQLIELYTQMGRKADADREFRAYLRTIAPWSLGSGSQP